MLMHHGVPSRKLLPQPGHGSRRLGKALGAVCFPLTRLHHKSYALRS